MLTSVATEADLLPRPRSVRHLPGSAKLHAGITVNSDDEPASRRFATEIRALVSQLPGQRTSARNAPTVIRIDRTGCRRKQGYRLRIRPGAIVLCADSESGLRFGIATLRQLLTAGRPAVRSMEIADWPDFDQRGVMLDISRCKVPTMTTLHRLVDLFAGWKINHLQLYTEHTFAYRGHEVVWHGASPMTGAQIEQLDARCRVRGIELVPNQNSFGHMERWLKHERYRHLAETNGEWISPWGDTRRHAATLNPTHPDSITLVASLYDQLLSHFTSRQLNVGCDETFELGQGRSREACRRRGTGNVYFDFLRQIHREVRRHGRSMLFWSDIVHQYPELIARLPKDAIPLVWGYEHDAPFARSCKLLQGSGLPFYVCPGTSSWCSFSGRSSTCLANIELAARIGHRCGGAGLLITDWGDFGHRQYLPVSYAGFLFGAAVAWCGASNQNLDVPAELSRHVFHDPSGNAGRAWFDAGTVHEASGIRLMNKTVLFRVMNAPLDDRTACADLMADQVDAMADRLRRTRKTASRAHFNTVDGPTVRDEMDATLAILDHACRRTRAMNSTGSAQRTWHSLAADMHEIMCRHRALWRARNRPGGLSESLTYYRRNLEEYEVRAGMRRRRRRQPRGG